MLSRSGALAVQLVRDQLDPAVGSAVRSSEDARLLVRWQSTDMDSADFKAVKPRGQIVGRWDPPYLAFRTPLGLMDWPPSRPHRDPVRWRSTASPWNTWEGSNS
jgi:hypothetical protein